MDSELPTNFDDTAVLDIEAAAASTGNGKRGHDECAFEVVAKKIAVEMPSDDLFAGALTLPSSFSSLPNQVASASAAPPSIHKEHELKPFPFFYYHDHSRDVDPDPLTPLTPPGRVPNFPAKMHAILSCPDLADIIAWMPHGRSWRVLKPREFEIRVIPAYFEHAKFTSFIRQANGWGFRRITQGPNRQTYYHPRFLRGLPHLCKQMKRPGVAEKVAADPDHEPDLDEISRMFPVPEKTDDESILLQCTLKGGPKARMPIYSGYGMAQPKNEKKSLTPTDQLALAAFQESLGASESQLTKVKLAPPAPAPGNNQVLPSFGLSFPPKTPKVAVSQQEDTTIASPLALANQLAFLGNPNMGAAAFQPSAAASQFAAGFAAATALSQQQFAGIFAALQQQGLVPQIPAKPTPELTRQSSALYCLDGSFTDPEDSLAVPPEAIYSPDEFW